MKTPKKGGRYKRLADGSVVPVDAAQQPAQQEHPETTIPPTAPAQQDELGPDDPQEGD